MHDFREIFPRARLAPRDRRKLNGAFERLPSIRFKANSSFGRVPKFGAPMPPIASATNTSNNGRNKWNCPFVTLVYYSALNEKFIRHV